MRLGVCQRSSVFVVELQLTITQKKHASRAETLRELVQKLREVANLVR